MARLSPRGSAAAFHVYLHRGTDGSGNPTFEDVTAASGIPEFPTKVPNVEIADIDNDGWPDLLTSVSAADGAAPAVFRSRGLVNGVLKFETPAGLGNPLYWVTAATGDFDRDGRLDTLMVHFEPWDPSRLFLNRTAGGRWLRVEIDGPTDGVGSVVEVYAPGRLGDPAALIGVREVETGTGYSAGVPAWTHFGLGTQTTVDVRVRPPRGAPVIDRRGVPAGQTLVITP